MKKKKEEKLKKIKWDEEFESVGIESKVILTLEKREKEVARYVIRINGRIYLTFTDLKAAEDSYNVLVSGGYQYKILKETTINL
jgi:hypothetical protein